MRRENHPPLDVIVLSRRNLLTLLMNLDGYPEGSVCEIIGGKEAPNVLVRAEEDSVHYALRAPGVMRPETERAMRL